MDASSEEKNRLRSSIRARRRELLAQGSADTASASALRTHLARLTVGLEIGSQDPNQASGGQAVIAAFHPTAAEPPLLAAWEDLAFSGFILLFPAFSPQGLDWVPWDGSTDFLPSAAKGFGLEPAGERMGVDALQYADLVIAPALAVSEDGTRLGQGGGYYDRALLHCRPQTPIFAAVHPHEVLAAGELPRCAHDFPVDGAVTAAGITLCGASG
ncbi:5-formyltetrahydrofolate cyclo-ligase [Dermabacteraceae bacterium TAE3-ERU5]|nr:5-formyltetrahydrofolate cyclo-ligase [Dermabacteraceae bacterium TAE3-ERU5]